MEPEPPSASWAKTLALARKLGLSTHDASYLDLAMRAGLPLTTADAALRRAAKRFKSSWCPPAGGWSQAGSREKARY